ncbi:MAG: phospholipase D-like domain-containing protein [Desulfosudis oleivorans]|nr:phospholipase D-like domain-containing protein [Desulfosudis oleivorans]
MARRQSLRAADRRSELFPRMLEAVEQAARFVWIEIYLFESGQVTSRVIEALTRAVRRGVEVRLLADDYGAFRLAAGDRERLRAGGVQLAFYNPLRYYKWMANLFRDHRKILIVDGEVAFVTGAGITDDFADPEEPQRSWRETAVRVSGPVVQDWQQLFLRVWTQHSHADRQRVAVAGCRRRQGHAGPGGHQQPDAPAGDLAVRSCIACSVPRPGSGWPPRTSCRRATCCGCCGARRRAASTCGCCCPARSPTTRRCATPAGGSTAGCCVTACAFTSTSRVSCMPRARCATRGYRSVPATSTAGTCAGTWRPTRR